MPYTRAYQLPAFLQDGEENKLLNITPSSNLIQETFNVINQVLDIKAGRVFVIEKATRPSLYQRLVAMQTRAILFKPTFAVSELEPSAEQIKKLTKEAGGDLTKLARLIEEWGKKTIEEYTGVEFSNIIVDVSDDRILLNADVILARSCSSVKITISSPEMPTKGDLPVTAIFYSPAIGDKAVADSPIRVGATGITGEEVPFSWTDKSGFESTIMILPNVIYEIQPVSIQLGYELTLLA